MFTRDPFYQGTHERFMTRCAFENANTTHPS